MAKLAYYLSWLLSIPFFTISCSFYIFSYIFSLIGEKIYYGITDKLELKIRANKK